MKWFAAIVVTGLILGGSLAVRWLDQERGRSAALLDHARLQAYFIVRLQENNLQMSGQLRRWLVFRGSRQIDLSHERVVQILQKQEELAREMAQPTAIPEYPVWLVRAERDRFHALVREIRKNAQTGLRMADFYRQARHIVGPETEQVAWSRDVPGSAQP